MDVLKAEIEAMALVRRAAAQGAFATVARRGDADAGSILVKVLTPDGLARLFSPTWDIGGRRRWTEVLAQPVPDREADEALARRMASDPDLWVVEIEDREGRTFLIDGG
jgi:hypothetical protein